VIAKIIISTSPDELSLWITKFLDGISLKRNHPDVLFLEAGIKLGIEQAKKIRSHLSTKPFSATGKIIIIEEGSLLTTQAQNALLKTLEELPSQAQFIIGSSSDEVFLPTVLSRCQIEYLKGGKSLANNLKTEVEKLLDQSLEEKFAFVEKTKDREEILSCLTEIYHQKLKNDPANEQTVNFLKNLQEAEKWRKSNVNIRGILEYLFLISPSNNRG